MKKALYVFIASIALTLLITAASAENRTRDEAVAWANARYNEAWQQDYDGINGCQDIDLIKYYYSWLGANRVYGYAYAYVNCQLPSGWTRSNMPQAGDIVVWGANAGIAGQYGHIGIVTEVNGSYITYVATNDGAVQCTKHTISRYNATTYIHPSFVSYVSLDVNWRIDGANNDSTQSAGTVDVYIDGKKVADDVSDYYAEHVKGSSYEISDIKANSGYRYIGVYSGSLTGTLNAGRSVRLSFETYVPAVSGASVIITGTDVPVRAYPNTYSGIVGTAMKDGVYAYLGSTFTDTRGVNWYGISFYGQSGWVSSKLSALKDDPSGFEYGDNVNVTGGNTNIRDYPNLYSNILGVAYKGSSWTYLGGTSVDDRGITWYEISYNRSPAWISSKYTELVKTASSDPWSDWGSDSWGGSWSDSWGGYKPSIARTDQSAYLVSNNPVVDGAKAFDGDSSTCWCVSEYNYSFGQWVEVSYTGNLSASGFSIINGYDKIRNGNDYWQLNSRVSAIAVYCDGSLVGTYSLSDTRVRQTISFGRTVSGKTFRFVIRGAYYGSKYADVCISEIGLY